MATVVKSFAIQGVDGYTVDIESKVGTGGQAPLTKCERKFE